MVRVGVEEVLFGVSEEGEKLSVAGIPLGHEP